MTKIHVSVHRAGCQGDGCRCADPSPALRRRIQESLAVGVLAGRFRSEHHGGWSQSSDEERRDFARRLLTVRLRLNRAGLLRWRVVRWNGTTP